MASCYPRRLTLTPKVSFLPDNIEVEVPPGENLLRAALAGDVALNAACGGSGTCGKCKVRVQRGTAAANPGPQLTEEEIAEGYVLACASGVTGDIDVELPAEALRVAAGRPSERVQKVLQDQLLSGRSFEDRLPTFTLDPLTRKCRVSLPPPSLEDGEADLERFRRELAREHSVGEVAIDLPLLRTLAGTLRAGDWTVTASLFEGHEGVRLINLEPGDTTQAHYGVAVDVGTTTVVAELVDLSAGKVLASASDYNSQIRLGDDVISRIVYARKPEQLAELQSMVAKTINGLLRRLCQETGVGRQTISAMVAAGNTTMIHFLLGLPPRYIREEPYVPTADAFPSVSADELGIELPGAVVQCYPCVGSYVGGDIVAGILATGISTASELTLFIDMGTNGEMVLGNADWMLAAACSAGPAFEGGGVKHGMRATEGAIELVRVDRQTAEPRIITIGQQPPLGICGSGLIDAAAELFLARVVDPRGKLDEKRSDSRVRRGENCLEYVLAKEEDSGLSVDLVLTEVDIDNLVRAKGAVYAGMATLLDSVDLDVSQIDRVMIAGAFGNYLEIDKAIVIGLLPDLPAERFTFVGNSSLLGARLWLLAGEMRERAVEIAHRMTYLDLSTVSQYMDKYMSALFLPHTDMGLFPRVQEKMAALS